MDNGFFIRYHLGNGPLESLAGESKIILFLSSIILLMLTFNLPLVAGLFIIHYGIYHFFVPKISATRFVIRFALVMNLINILLFYLVNPTVTYRPVDNYHVLFSFTDYYVVTVETLLFFLTRLLKIFGTLFISLWFVMSITPSQLAAGLNRIGVPYKICSMIALSLRYIPDVHREFVAIKESMQMRGLELDGRKASIGRRLQANVTILLPLILSSFEKVDTIANAMELRGYGQGKKRTYYASQSKGAYDWFALGLAGIQGLGIMYILIQNLVSLVK